MTTKVSHGELATEVEPWHPSRPHAALAADVRWWLGSPFSLGLFGRLALDQVAYRPIAAAVDHSGRFRQNFTDRGVRSFTFGMLMLFGDDSDRRWDTDELKRLHAAVRGAGNGEFEGTRFSALDPELWNWIAVSSLNLFYRGYVAVRGEDLDDEQREAVYQTLRWMLSYLELPSARAKLPETLPDMLSYYDRVAAEKLADNSFLQYADESFDAVPVPELLPKPVRDLVAPVWNLVVPIALRPPKVLGQRLAHAKMRELLDVRQTGTVRLEYACYLMALRLAWRHLPKRLVLDPLAYNRYRYERLRAAYQSVQLDSFAA
ncbi:oxygenase MpaB family protein [Mycobacterium sp. MAA66]|uniref:oxygenase MpaB family protein n=1 Tax=Mycobacterium sp. MAA66 TaxID=3156297 RepID=UPI003516FFBB